jgi:hypothetical protein
MVAADDLPGPVVTFLNVIGIDWPYLNEDQIRQFATMVREFGQAVEQTHLDATVAIRNISEAYQGAATRQLSSGWSHLSAQHVDEIVDGCRILADGLDVGADFVVGQKIEAAIELGVMAATFVADQAAAVATFGLAEAAVPVIIAAGKALVETLKQQIIQYIVGEVIEAAAKPLFAKVENALSGLDWSNAPAGEPGVGKSFSIEPGTVAAHTAVLRGHAETMRAGLGGLSF